jgi:hypothetical protein
MTVDKITTEPAARVNPNRLPLRREVQAPEKLMNLHIEALVFA